MNTNLNITAKAKKKTLKKCEHLFNGKPRNKIGCQECSPVICFNCGYLATENTIRRHLKKCQENQMHICQEHGNYSIYCKKCPNREFILRPENLTRTSQQIYGKNTDEILGCIMHMAIFTNAIVLGRDRDNYKEFWDLKTTPRKLNGKIKLD
jgi:hypothetical protein